MTETERAAAMNRPENVAAQYADDKGLAARQRLYQKHATNPQPIGAWLMEQYAFPPGARVLELGCGNGAQWEALARGREKPPLPPDALLVLTDLSPGMVGVAWEKYGACPGVLTLRADVQDLPFPAESFDVVIANHMLYHVPNLPGAVDEMHRVVKPTGALYAATNGNGGLLPWLHRALKDFKGIDAFGIKHPFSLENGPAILGWRFGTVETRPYNNALHITDAQDLMDWVLSSTSITGLENADFTGLYDYFEGLRAPTGAIDVPLDVGLLVAWR